MKIEEKYICEICGASLRTKEICLEHEKSCREEKERHRYYSNRTKELSEDIHMFYAQSEDDMDKCMSAVFNSWTHTDGIEFPCIMLIRRCESYDHWDNGIDVYYEAETLDRHLSKIGKVKQELIDIENR